MLKLNTKPLASWAIATSAGFLLAAGLSLPAKAQEESADVFPFVEGTLDLEIGNDLTFNSDDPANELNDLFFTGELAVLIGLTEWLSINGGLTLESVLDPLPATDRYFGDLGLYVDTLNVQVDVGNVTIVVGKYGPGFGTAWDVTPGVYGTDFAEDYELAEMIGVGGALTLENMYVGTIVFGANVFFVDTTFLSDSAFTSRGRVMLADGGIGNTEELNNFSFTVDGSDIPGADGLFWHAGFSHLAAGIGDVSDQNGFVFGIGTERELANGIVITVNGEIAYFDGFGGTLDDATYFTAGLAVANGPWHGEVAGTARTINVAGGPSVDDFIAQISGGYEFENGVDLSAGIATWRDGGVEGQTFGLRLTKSLEFSTRN